MNTTKNPPPGDQGLAFQTHALQMILFGPFYVRTQHCYGSLRIVSSQYIYIYIYYYLRSYICLNRIFFVPKYPSKYLKWWKYYCKDTIRNEPNSVGFAREKALTMSFVERGFERLDLGYQVVGFSWCSYGVKLSSPLESFSWRWVGRLWFFGHFSQPPL